MGTPLEILLVQRGSSFRTKSGKSAIQTVAPEELIGCVRGTGQRSRPKSKHLMASTSDQHDDKEKKALCHVKVSHVNDLIGRLGMSG